MSVFEGMVEHKRGHRCSKEDVQKNKLGGAFYTIEKSLRELQKSEGSEVKDLCQNFGSTENRKRKSTQRSQVSMLRGLNP